MFCFVRIKMPRTATAQIEITNATEDPSEWFSIALVQILDEDA
jgi:hypothetical protein